MVDTKTSSAGYATPASLDEAVRLLANTADARVLAGGHGLLIEPGRSRYANSLFVDLRKVPGLTGIQRDASGGVKIGAMTTLSAIAADAGLRKAHPALASAADATGDAQLRNRATVGGSLANSDPDADFPALALALDATIEIAGSKGARKAKADDFYGGAPLQKGEVITALTLPAPAARTATAYAVSRNPTTLGPICGIVASVTLGGDGAVTASRVAITGAAERPTRLAGAEQAITGKKAGETTAAAAGAAAAAETAARGDLFASAEYRKHLIRVLTERAIKQAFEGAGR
jgi:aerobic carbon-monoxide dehydrogenase medium subunit